MRSRRIGWCAPQSLAHSPHHHRVVTQTSQRFEVMQGRRIHWAACWTGARPPLHASEPTRFRGRLLEYIVHTGTARYRLASSTHHSTIMVRCTSTMYKVRCVQKYGVCILECIAVYIVLDHTGMHTGTYIVLVPEVCVYIVRCTTR